MRSAVRMYSVPHDMQATGTVVKSEHSEKKERAQAEWAAVFVLSTRWQAQLQLTAVRNAVHGTYYHLQVCMLLVACTSSENQCGQ